MLILKKLHFWSYFDRQSVHFWKKSIYLVILDDFVDPKAVALLPSGGSAGGDALEDTPTQHPKRILDTNMLSHAW